MSLLLVVAAAAAAKAAASPLTLQEARRMSPHDLATRVLGEAGAIYREAHIHPGGGGFGMMAFTSITFVTVPRSAGFPGLCVADQVYVTFEPLERGRADPPRRPRRLDTSSVYRIVGDTTDRREGTDESENALERQCARSGPVLNEASRPQFFTGRRLTGAEAYLSARLLQTVIAAASRGPVENLTCAEGDAEGNERLCADPRASLAGLSTDRLSYVEIDRCPQNPVHLCANLSFSQALPGQMFKIVQVDIETDISRADPPPGAFRIMAIAIRSETGIED